MGRRRLGRQERHRLQSEYPDRRSLHHPARPARQWACRQHQAIIVSGLADRRHRGALRGRPHRRGKGHARRGGVEQGAGYRRGRAPARRSGAGAAFLADLEKRAVVLQHPVRRECRLPHRAGPVLFEMLCRWRQAGAGTDRGARRQQKLYPYRLDDRLRQARHRRRSRRRTARAGVSQGRVGVTAPKMLEKFERYPLTFGPTPIEKLSRLAAHLGGKVEIYAKREDCNSGLAFGGNKLRKLEYIVPDAIASNADTLVSIGGVQSNHTRMVAAVAAKIGMKCRLVQESWVPHEDAVYDRVGNILLSRIMGAELEMVDEGFDIGIRQSWEDAIADVKAKGGKPYPIPAGASVHKYGWLGYVGFAEEVRAQEKELGFAFDYIVVCPVTGSTHAGMLVGFAKDGRARKVIGIDGSFTPAQTKAQVLQIAQNTAALVELGQNIVADDVVLIEDYAYPAYGVPSEQTKQAIRLCARLEGMITDPVYEGKSMQAMIDLVMKGYFPEGSKVLYAHLGGAPALNGYAYSFRNG